MERAKKRLETGLRQCAEAQKRIRYLIILNLLNGRGPTETARVLGVGRSTVYEVARRFREQGEAGLVDHREENGERRLDEWYLVVLYEVVKSSPQEHGWRRPTWTREMLVATLCQKTGVRIHVATMSKALKRIDARHGRPKPTVNCPSWNSAKNKRLRGLQRLIADLPPDEVAVYEDEIDIHLNPKIGLDWMVRGQQKEGNPHARPERETLSRRGPRRPDRRNRLGGRRDSEKQLPVHSSAVGTREALPRRQDDSRDLGQLRDPHDRAG